MSTFVSLPVRLLDRDAEGAYPQEFGPTAAGYPVLLSTDGAYICALFSGSGAKWAVYRADSLVVKLRTGDGQEMLPQGIWIGGRTFWQGGGWTLKYSPAHARWILEENTIETHCPTATQKWNSEEWEGDAWYEGTSYTGAFEAKGTLLNGGDPGGKTVEAAPVPRWERTEDSLSEAPCGIYEGVDGETGTFTIGLQSYSEGSVEWVRVSGGKSLSSSAGETAVQGSIAGIGRCYYFERDGVLYAYSAENLQPGKDDLEFLPYTYDAEAETYVPAEDCGAITFAYAGFRASAETSVEWICDPVIWR